MSRRLPGRVARSVVLLLALQLALPSALLALSPVPGGAQRFAPDALLTYRFAGSPPAWFVTAVNTALQNGWTVNNNSLSPRFAYSATGAGVVSFSGTTGVPACDSIDWLACFRFNGGLSWNIWLRNTTSWSYCESALVNGCFMAKRAILHEAEHLTAAVGDFAQTPTSTNMSTGFNVTRPNPGWDSTSPRECDEAMLQLTYGVRSRSGSIGDCFDGFPNATPSGLATQINLSGTNATTCLSRSVTLSARLFIKDFDNYRLLGGINLASRTLLVDRKLSTSSTWTLGWASATTNGNGGTSFNWSRALTHSAVATVNYRLRFAAMNGLAAATSPTFTVKYTSTCPI